MALKEPEPGDWEKLLDFAERLLGGQLSPYIAWPLGLLILITLILIITTVAALATAKLKEVWQNHLRPKAYSPEQRQKAEGRRQFAQHLQLEIVTRNRTENWRDQQFTELEAEVEAEGAHSRFWPWKTSANGIRREKSLSLALRRSTERLILVEGDPGAGKSVALRHVAHALAVRASKARSLTSKLPAYINLKEIKRATDQPIDRELIRNFVLTSLNRVNDRFVDEFIEHEFDAGLKSGTWVFLFDSFDEIPDILSSTESDEAIEQYSAAISDFLSGINSCRGVVASRHYRGPQKAGWRTFRILELQPRRQLDLIKRSMISKPKLAQKIHEHLAVASDDVRVLARNPMLLGLLCEHVKLGNEFPETGHEVLSKYIDYRLTRDKLRVSLRFNISKDSLREIAENCAFTMTANAQIGLSPTLVELKKALIGQGLANNLDRLEDGLNALVYMKLGRFSHSDTNPDEQEFTFSHRRFQEHFATCVVLNGARSITAEQLLTDARWRETAVTLLQTGDAAAVQTLLACARGFVGITPEQRLSSNTDTDPSRSFPWTAAQLHVLRILEAGSLGSVERIPAVMRAEIGALLEAASASDNLLDKKLALEIAGTASHDTLIALMRDALATGSVWLSDAVYLQAARLSVPVPEIYRSVRTSVLRLSRSGALSKEYIGTKAYLSRMPSPANLLAALRLAYYSPLIDFVLFPVIVIGAALWFTETQFSHAGIACGLFLISGLVIRRAALMSPVGMLGINLRFFSGLIAIFSTSSANFEPRLEGSVADVRHFGDVIDILTNTLLKPPATVSKLYFPGVLDSIIIFYICTVFYSVFWYISAEYNIRRGRYLSPFAWPLFPLLSLYDIFMSSVNRPERIKQMLSTIAGATVFPILLLIVIPLFPPLAIMLSIGMIAMIVTITVGFLILVFVTIMDFRYLRAWSREYATAVDVEAFVTLLKRIDTSWVAIMALRGLADKPLTGPPAPWISAIEEAIEVRTQRSRRFARKDLAAARASVASRIAGSTMLGVLFKSNFVEQRDLLYRLLERVTAPERVM